MLTLDENFTINKDPHCFILNYERQLDEVNPKTGKRKVRKSQSYHASIQAALRSYIDQKVLLDHTPHSHQADELLDTLNQIHNTIKSL